MQQLAREVTVDTEAVTVVTAKATNDDALEIVAMEIVTTINAPRQDSKEKRGSCTMHNYIVKLTKQSIRTKCGVGFQFPHEK